MTTTDSLYNMTTEQEAAFLKLGFLGDDELFLAGWEAALEDRPIVVETLRLVARQTERHEMRQQLMDKAVASFSKGDDEAAMIYRKMANELFGKPAL